MKKLKQYNGTIRTIGVFKRDKKMDEKQNVYQLTNG